MPEQSVVWWTFLAVLALAAVFDLCSWRVPNWLTLPFLLAGIALQIKYRGFPGAGRSIAGMAVACLLFGIPCWLGAMGLGDLKLAAGVGAWLGAAQFLSAAVFTGLVGGVFAVAWAMWHGSLSANLDSTGDLLTPWRARPSGHKKKVREIKDAATSFPYAPSIALGSLLALLAR